MRPVSQPVRGEGARLSVFLQLFVLALYSTLGQVKPFLILMINDYPCVPLRPRFDRTRLETLSGSSEPIKSAFQGILTKKHSLERKAFAIASLTILISMKLKALQCKTPCILALEKLVVFNALIGN